MKFLVLMCLLAVAAADEEQTQENTTDNNQTQKATLPTQTTGSLLNTQKFPPSSFNVFGTKDSGIPFTGFNGNIAPIHTVNPDFFGTTQGLVNTGLSGYPVTRTILPGASGLVSGIQSAFPAASSVLQSVPVVNTIGTHFPAVAQGVLSGISSVPAVSGLTAAGVPNGGYQTVPGAFRFQPILSQEGVSAVPTQTFQTNQGTIPNFGNVPAFTSGILPSLGTGIVNAGQSVLKNPTNTQGGIPNVSSLQGGNSNVFRHA